jgi:hypothetical protein
MKATVRRNPVAWENFYKTARWRRLRKLMQPPLCKFCLERGIVTRANVVAHVAPHRALDARHDADHHWESRIDRDH